MGQSLLDFLQRPTRVFFACLVFMSIQFVMTGSLWEMLQLAQRRIQVVQSIESNQKQLVGLKNEIQIAKDPAQIRKKATDLYDWVSEDSLVFVFSE